MSETVLNENALLVGEGVVLDGSISALGVAKIHGTFNGEIQATELQIGSTGVVSGNVEANVIQVRGQLSEKILCHSHLVIHRTGVVTGHLDYAHIEIERGGQVIAKLLKHPPGEAKS